MEERESGWVWHYNFKKMIGLIPSLKRWHLRKILKEFQQGAMWTHGVGESQPGERPAQKFWGRKTSGTFNVSQGGQCGWGAGGMWEGEFIGGEIRADFWVVGYSQGVQLETTDNHGIAALKPGPPILSPSRLHHWPLAPGPSIDEEHGAWSG